MQLYIFIAFVLFVIFAVICGLELFYQLGKNESILNNFQMYRKGGNYTPDKRVSKLSYTPNKYEIITIDEPVGKEPVGKEPMTKQSLAKKYNLTKLETESYAAEKSISTKIPYMSPESNKQIQTLLKGNKKDMFLVLELLAKHVGHDPKGFIKTIINKGWALLDSDIYNMIKTTKITEPAKKPNQTDTTRDSLHADLYVGYLRKYLPEFKPTMYLDFGCGDCNKTELIGKLLGLDPKNVHGVDVNSSVEEPAKEPAADPKISEIEPKDTSFLHYDVGRNSAVNFKLIKNNKLDYPDGAFDLISAFMVLHHCNELREVCAEISRALRSGGVLILREHDAYNSVDYMLCDIEHAIYDLGYPGANNAARNPNFVKNYYAVYHTWIEWAEILAEFGFKLVAIEYDNFSIKKNIGPTRYMCLVFLKN